MTPGWESKWGGSLGLYENTSEDKPGKIKRSIATTPDIIKTKIDISTLKRNPKVAPSKPEWANVSPKYASLLQMTKQPKGPATIAMPTPAIRDLTKKSSNIILICYRLDYDSDHDRVYTKIRLMLRFPQKFLCMKGLLLHHGVFLNSKHDHLSI